MSKERQIVGVVAVDRLRLIGLQTILEEGSGVLSRGALLEDAIAAKDLAAVVLDTTGMDDLTDVLARFRDRCPEAKVIVVGEEHDPGNAHTVIAAGARGYLTASANEAEIRAAIDAVLDGLVWAPRKVAAKLADARAHRCGKAVSFSGQMTQREREVLHLLQNGRTNRQIADSMGIEPVTVKAHLGRMLRKAGAKNRVELTLKALAEAAARAAGAGRLTHGNR